MALQPDCQSNQQNDPLHERLLVQGEVALRPDDTVTVSLERGQKVESCEGKDVGILAALILDMRRQLIDQLLLCQLVDAPEYRRVPLELVDKVKDGIIRLKIQSDDVLKLSIH